MVYASIFLLVPIWKSSTKKAWVSFPMFRLFFDIFALSEQCCKPTYRHWAAQHSALINYHGQGSTVSLHIPLWLLQACLILYSPQTIIGYGDSQLHVLQYLLPLLRVAGFCHHSGYLFTSCTSWRSIVMRQMFKVYLFLPMRRTLFWLMRSIKGPGA